MSEQTEGERLAAFEAILQRVESKLDKVVDNYPTRHELDEMLKSRDERIIRLESDMKENKKVWREWLGVIIAAGALAVSWYHKLG